jgi:hypothetical protein
MRRPIDPCFRPLSGPLSASLVLSLVVLLVLAGAPAALAQGAGGAHPDSLSSAPALPVDEEPEPPVEGEEDEEEDSAAEERPDGEDGEAEDGDEEEKEKWDVTVPPGPASEVTIDVDAGTWMSLDVSPDGADRLRPARRPLRDPDRGRRGQAAHLGPAWDMQPRFSPDGGRIAFTSDRGGGDNVWVMDRDGG